MAYYNTLEKSGTSLKKAIKKAQSQTEDVLKLIIKHKTKTLTARILWAYYEDEVGAILLTSIRRSISTLVEIGLISYKHKGGATIKHSHVCKVHNFLTTENEIVINT